MSVTQGRNLLVRYFYSLSNHHRRATSPISAAATAPLVMLRSSYFGPGLALPPSIVGLRADGHLLLVPLLAAACVVLAVSFTSPETQDIAKDIQDESIEEDCVEAPPPAGLWRSFTTKSQGGEKAGHDYRERSGAQGKSTSRKVGAPDEQKVMDEPDFDMFTGPPLRIPPRRLDSVSSEDLGLGPVSLKARPSTDVQVNDMNDDTTSSEARSTLRANAKAFVPTRDPLRPNASPFTPGRLGLRATTPVFNRIHDSRLRADAPKFSPKRKSRRGDEPQFTSGRKVLRAGAPAFTPGRIGFRSAELVLPPRKTLRSDAPPFTPGPLAKFTKNQPQCSN